MELVFPLYSIVLLLGLILVLAAAIICIIAFSHFRFLTTASLDKNTLMDNLPDGIIIFNSKGEVIDINPGALKLIGYDKNLLTKDESELGALCSQISAGNHLELALEKCGQIYYLDVCLSPIRSPDGNLQGKLVVLRDITERKISRQNLETLYNGERDLRSNLQEEIENRSKYTRALVHELKTPLTAILSSSELLEYEAHRETFSAIVKNIRTASLNMETRIDELLDLARGEVGMLKVELEPLDMAELLSGIVREIKPAAEARRLELVLELAELLLVNGNRDRLRLVLVNLISNAIKYTDRGQIRIIARDFASENLLVRVEDTGRGLSEEQIKQLFDPFRRPSTDGQKYSGLGIGLALCKLYIELHHGKIWVESEQGKGARFSFTVPVFQEKTDLPNKSQNAASR